MKKFKERWEIENNSQLFIPFLGILGLLYSAYKIVGIYIDSHESSNIAIFITLTLIVYFILLKLTLYAFKKLEKKWIVERKWEMISLFLVFAITGSSSVFIGRPILKMIGITKENLNIAVYWIFYIVLGLIFYQVLLVIVGYIFGQFKFFWKFEKKILRRFGFKFADEN